MKVLTVKKDSLHLVSDEDRVMSKKLEKIISKAEKDLDVGSISPAFSISNKAISWLKKVDK